MVKPARPKPQRNPKPPTSTSHTKIKIRWRPSATGGALGYLENARGSVVILRRPEGFAITYAGQTRAEKIETIEEAKQVARDQIDAWVSVKGAT